jgi:hypothetical protein
MKRQHEIDADWQNEDDWLCTVEFVPAMTPRAERLPQTSSAICLAIHS